MSRYYRKRNNFRYRRKHKRSNNTANIFLILLAIMFLPITIIIGIIYVIIKINNWCSSDNDAAQPEGCRGRKPINDTSRNCDDEEITEQNSDINKSSYKSKSSFMSDCEKTYFDTIVSIVGEDYIVQPQINLASIVDKKSKSKYRAELFRNIDFGIFDKNYNLLVLIEINDSTHTQKNRYVRDQKVKAICEEANITLITFWTKYGVNKDYIKKRISEVISLPV